SWRWKSPATRCTSTRSREPARSSIPASSSGGKSSGFSGLFCLRRLLLLAGGFRGGARLRPIGLEHGRNLSGDARVGDDQAHLAAAVELQLAQALAADEGGAAVAHDRPD